MGSGKLGAGSWKWEVGSGKLEAGSLYKIVQALFCKFSTDNRQPRTDNDIRGLKLGAGSWKLEVGSWELEAGSWKLGVGSWKLTENGIRL